MLPGLAAHARTVRSRTRELQFIVGDAAGQDFVRLDSRRGSIRVGASGVDDGGNVHIADKQFRPMGGPGILGGGAKQFRF